MKRKITVTTGSRSEYGILRPVLHEINTSKKLELCLIVTGMHLSKKYGSTIDEIKKDGFNIASIIEMLPRGDSGYFMADALGKGIINFARLFHRLQPDINLILGDRDEMLASALAAYHMNIPNAHIHGGDRSQGGIDEYNRHAITKISNIHFAATKKSYERIKKMGEDPRFVFLTGSPSIDEIKNQKITSKSELEYKYKQKFTGNEILLLQHPVTTEIELSKKHITEILKAICRIKKSTIAIAPNSDAGSKIVFNNLKRYSQKYDFINVFPSIPRSDYLGMIKNCGVLVGNSSSGMIEASCFGTPVVNLGIRQKGRERRKGIIDVPQITERSVYDAIFRVLTLKKNNKVVTQSIYGKGDSSKKIIKYLENIKLNKELIQKQISY